MSGIPGRPRCAVLDDFQDVAFQSADWSSLSDRVEITRFGRTIPADELAGTLAPFEIIVAMRERTVFDSHLLAALPRLKLLVTTGMVNAAIDMNAAAGRNILVCGTRGRVGPAAELAWGLLLALMRHIPRESEAFRKGSDQWQHTLGSDLMGKTLGVVGLGRLGSRIAAYGQAFQMNVLGWSRSNTPERSEELGVTYRESLSDLLAESDVVSLHLTLNDETRGIIGASELRTMKPEAVLINTSRGPLVNEEALVEALRQGWIGGAGLDVFDVEPLPLDHPLRRLDNVIATPHLGYVTRETYEGYFNGSVECIASWLDGAPVRILNG